MNKFTYLIIIIIIIVLGWWLLSDRGIDVAAINQAITDGEAVLLDVRTTAERASDGYAAGSTHFDLARLQAGEFPDVDKDMMIYTYCKGGTRAGEAKTILEDNGFTNVKNIGGLSDWEAAGGTVVK